MLSRHVSYPGKAHIQAVKRIFRYLQGTSQYRLEYQSDDEMDSGLHVFVDSDWAGNRVDRKSISGFVVMFKGGAVS